MSEPRPEKSASSVVWLATIALFVVGFGALFLAVTAADGEDFVGAGVCGIAAALSFGAVLNAVLRR
jgi:hypothetical protein